MPIPQELHACYLTRSATERTHKATECAHRQLGLRQLDVLEDDLAKDRGRKAKEHMPEVVQLPVALHDVCQLRVVHKLDVRAAIRFETTTAMSTSLENATRPRYRMRVSAPVRVHELRVRKAKGILGQRAQVLHIDVIASDRGFLHEDAVAHGVRTHARVDLAQCVSTCRKYPAQLNAQWAFGT